MKTIRDLNAPPHVVGRVEAIIVRGSPRDPARSIEASEALAGVGLADNRLGKRGEAEPSTRQVTRIQAEHLAVIAQLAGVAAVDPVRLRRNIVVRESTCLRCATRRCAWAMQCWRSWASARLVREWRRRSARVATRQCAGTAA
jgi:MOSC domain-containing protein YiiM